MQSYVDYQENPISLTMLQPPPKTCCRVCCNMTSMFFSYLFVSYLSANAAILACFKTNCTLPHNLNFTESNGTSLVIHNKQIIEILSISEAVSGFLFVIILFCRFINCIKRENY